MDLKSLAPNSKKAFIIFSKILAGHSNKIKMTLLNEKI